MEMMTNSASCIRNSFFLYLLFTLLYTLFFLFPRKGNGLCEHFYNGELPSLTYYCFSVYEIFKFVFSDGI